MPVADDNQSLACSECFEDQGLRLDAHRLGSSGEGPCPACGSKAGNLLKQDDLGRLAHRFFVWGSLHRCDYGAAPVIQFNEHQKTSIRPSPWLEKDIAIFENQLGVGFFHYGPRLWMVGEINPLNELQSEDKSPRIIDRILSEYPTRVLDQSQKLFRIRKEPNSPTDFSEYDSPPEGIATSGRLDSPELPVLYASEDLEVCTHECRVTAEDEIYLATLRPARELKMLDLTHLLKEEKVTEFESLDLAVHMLFLAGQHSYPVARSISLAAKAAGFDGLIYPSYFSLLRLGIMPFQTSYGLSHRRLPHMQEYEQSTAVPNAAFFGRPISSGDIDVVCINRLVLSQVAYDFRFGPVQN